MTTAHRHRALRLSDTSMSSEHRPEWHLGQEGARVESSVYLRLLVFLLAILIQACASSSLAFLMMYSAYKLNKQGDKFLG